MSIFFNDQEDFILPADYKFSRKDLCLEERVISYLHILGRRGIRPTTIRLKKARMDVIKLNLGSRWDGYVYGPSGLCELVEWA